MRVLVVGGGVAGSATALAARRAGFGATVLERRERVDPTEGSWITLAPNGVDVLEHLGLLDAARAVGWAGRTNRLFDTHGRLLGEVPLGTPLADGTVALTMRRSAVAALIAEAATAAGAELVLGARVDAVATGPAPGSEEVWADLADGSRVGGQVLVGADGVWSRVRRALDPGAPAPRYVGQVNFGGITDDTEWSERLAPEAWHFVFGRRCFTGCFPLTDGRVVWFVNVPRPPVGADERARTTEEQWRAELVDLASADVGPAAELIAAGRLELSADSTHDLGHVPRWRGPASVLVGDAVHAPSPSSGQGAAMALEDAAVLVRALRAHGLPGLAEYEQARRRRVEGIVRSGARTTSAKAPGAVGRGVRDAMMRALAATGVLERDVLRTTAHRLEPAPLAST